MSLKEQQELQELVKQDPRFFFEQEFFCKMYLDNPDKTIKTLIDLRDAGGVFVRSDLFCIHGNFRTKSFALFAVLCYYIF